MAVHIHCRKAAKECKYWIDGEKFDLDEAYSYNMNNKDKCQIKKNPMEQHLRNLKTHSPLASINILIKHSETDINPGNTVI